MKKNIEILDCTIRDGGYLNNWNFDKKIVREVYRSLSKSGVDIIEIGFKTSKKYINEDMGIWRYCNDDVIKDTIKNISGSKIGIMIDFGKLEINDIKEKENSVIDVIRVASHKNKIQEAIKFTEKIKDKNYNVSIQLMGYSTYNNDERKNIIKLLEESSIDYIYIADSYGSILPFQINDFFKPLVNIPNKKIGFHSHNNLQMAFINTIEAINSGVDIVDGSIYGMGRGAGNLPIEILISYLQLQDKEKYNVIPILHCIDKYFIELQKKIQWGYTLPYMLSGLFNSHPYYSKHLIELRDYTIEDIWKTLEIIKKIKPIGFSKELLTDLINQGVIGNKNIYLKDKKINFVYKKEIPLYINRHKNQNFLILGNGPTLKKYKNLIDKFIEKYNPIIMGANYLENLFVPYYHAFSNKRRFIDYIHTVNKKSNLLIGQNIPKDMIEKYTKRKYEKLCFKNISNNFDIQEGIIQTNCETISVLLIATSIVMGAKKIFSVGLDGYINASLYKTHFYKEKDTPKNMDIFIDKHRKCEYFLNQINDYLIKKNKEGFHILTPTSYKKFYKNIKNYI